MNAREGNGHVSATAWILLAVFGCFLAQVQMQLLPAPFGDTLLHLLFIYDQDSS